MPLKNKKEYNAYMREYLAKKYDTRRTKFLEMLGNKCSKCASTENLYFSPTKDADPKFDLGKKMNNASMKKVTEEVMKHILVCASCRAKERNGVEHGGGISGVRNCKCEPCKKKKAEYMRAYMEKKRKSEKS